MEDIDIEQQHTETFVVGPSGSHAGNGPM